MLKITPVEKADMRVSEWSGGTTTEIFIYPRGAEYKDRDFVFRISTATVELDESDFTPLSGYERIIASLDGRMELLSGGGRTVIEPLSTVHRFDGGEATHCIGRARDLNLMLKKGCAAGELRFVGKGERAVVPLRAGGFALVYNTLDGSARIAEADEEDFLVFEAEEQIALFTVQTEQNNKK